MPLSCLVFLPLFFFLFNNCTSGRQYPIVMQKNQCLHSVSKWNKKLTIEIVSNGFPCVLSEIPHPKWKLKLLLSLIPTPSPSVNSDFIYPSLSPRGKSIQIFFFFF